MIAANTAAARATVGGGPGLHRNQTSLVHTHRPGLFGKVDDEVQPRQVRRGRCSKNLVADLGVDLVAGVEQLDQSTTVGQFQVPPAGQRFAVGAKIVAQGIELRQQRRDGRGGLHVSRRGGCRRTATRRAPVRRAPMPVEKSVGDRLTLLEWQSVELVHPSLCAACNSSSEEPDSSKPSSSSCPCRSWARRPFPRAWSAQDR